MGWTFYFLQILHYSSTFRARTGRVKSLQPHHEHDGLHHEKQTRRQQHGVEVGGEAVVDADL